MTLTSDIGSVYIYSTNKWVRVEINFLRKYIARYHVLLRCIIALTFKSKVALCFHNCLFLV